MQPATVPAEASATMLKRVDCTRQGVAINDAVDKRAEKCFQECRYPALRSIQCEFHEGVLVLRGRVTSYYLKQLAQEMVRTLADVELIVNVLEVDDPRS